MGNPCRQVSQYVEIDFPVLSARTERKALMNEDNGPAGWQPREIAQAFLQSVPVPAEVARKVQLVGQNGEQFLLAGDAARNADDQSLIVAKFAGRIDEE